MANANPKSRPRKQERTLTISTSGYQPISNDEQEGCFQLLGCQESRPYVSVPYIRLKGQWLAEAGFHRSHQVRVEISHGRLVITAK